MRHKHKEGKVTKAVENHTADVPSIVFLSAALASMAASITFHCFKKGKTALFIGQWAAPLLIMGVYNKIVKTKGNDNTQHFH
ncbi:MAG: hypothetical protein LIO77_10145 [Rikenellaceae bacterium]|nr:hypothetical protein [Rikenellaceae bacterium]